MDDAAMLMRWNRPAQRIAEALRARGQTIAVADGATGGLIAASLLTVPGAMDFFVGGGVVYSLKARDVLFALSREAYRGMSGASEDYALLQARAIRDNFGADWGIAESGSVGGSRHPSGATPGTSVVAIVGPAGVLPNPSRDLGHGEVTHRFETHRDDRIANMAAFTTHAIECLEAALAR